MLTSALLLLCQSLEPVPAVAERGAEVLIRTRAADGGVLADLPLTLRAPGGATRELGRTDARGELRFVAAPEGLLEVFAELPPRGPKLIVPVQVVAAARRWLWALVCVPPGIAILWLNRRAKTRGERAPE